MLPSQTIYTLARGIMVQRYKEEVRYYYSEVKKEFPDITYPSAKSRAITRLCNARRSEYQQVVEEKLEEGYPRDPVGKREKQRSDDQAKAKLRDQYPEKYQEIINILKKEYPEVSRSSLRSRAFTQLSHTYPLRYLEIFNEIRKERDVEK